MTMDITHHTLLSREEMTSILQERLLNIPTIENLSYEELLRIYNTFAVPLEKRVPKPLKQTPMPNEQPVIDPIDKKRTYVHDFHMQAVVLNGYMNGHSADPHQQTQFVKLSVNTISNTAKKRQYSVSVNGTTESTPAKRKPITWP